MDVREQVGNSARLSDEVSTLYRSRDVACNVSAEELIIMVCRLCLFDEGTAVRSPRDVGAHFCAIHFVSLSQVASPQVSCKASIPRQRSPGKSYCRPGSRLHPQRLTSIVNMGFGDGERNALEQNRAVIFFPFEPKGTEHCGGLLLDGLEIVRVDATPDSAGDIS